MTERSKRAMIPQAHLQVATFCRQAFARLLIVGGCLESYEPGQTICQAKTKACNHIFHKACIETWLKDHASCPICRSAI